MSVANVALIYALGLLGIPVDDGKTATAGATAQTTAAPILGEFARFTIARDATGGAGTNTNKNAAVLKSLHTNDAAPTPFVYVVNDSPNYIQVFAAVNDKMNGTLNASFAIPPAQSASFLRVHASLAGGPDWRASLIT